MQVTIGCFAKYWLGHDDAGLFLDRLEPSMMQFIFGSPQIFA